MTACRVETDRLEKGTLMFRSTLTAVVAIACVSATASAQTFLDRTAWEAAASGPVISPDYAAIGPVEFDPGVSADLGGFFDVLATGGVTGDADLNAAPNFVFDFDPAGLQSVTFTFDTPITAFGALWSNTFVQDGFAVTTGNGDTFDLEAVAGATLSSTFVGVIDAAGFSTLTFSTSPGGGDDFVFFNTFEFVEIPSPATAGLLGLGALAATRRRR